MKNSSREKRTRAFICGTFGAGKTTLLNKVLELLEVDGKKDDFFVAQDYARDMLKQMGKTADEIKGAEKSAFQHGLLVAYMGAAMRARDAQKILLGDGSPAEVMAYGDLEGKYHEPKCLLDSSIIFLVDHSGRELEKDGLRHTDEQYRDFIAEKVKNIILNTDAIVYQVPSDGTLEENAELVLQTLYHHTKKPCAK